MFFGCKRLLVLFFLCILLISSKGVQAGLSLADLLELASENNISFHQKELQFLESQEQLLRMEANYPLHTTRRALTQAQDDLFRYQEELQLAYLDLRREVKEDYFEVLKAKDLIALQEQALEQARLQKETAQTRLEGGLITPLEFRSFEHRFNEAQFSLKQARDRLEIALLRLKMTVGIDLTGALSLATYRPEPAWNIEYTFEQMLETALENRYQLQLARQRVTDLERDQDRMESIYYSTSEQKEVQLQLQQALLDLKNLERSLYLELWQLNNQLENSQLEIKLQEEELERVKEEHRLAQQQYGMGRISSQDLFSAHQLELQVESERITAIYNGLLLKVQLLTALGTIEEGGDGAP